MDNIFLKDSTAPFGAPRFDLLDNSMYIPAFEQGIAEAKARIDEIVSNPEPPTFENTIEAMEYAGRTLEKVESIFYNILEADSSDELQKIAEQVSPMTTKLQLYIMQHKGLFERVKAVYSQKDGLSLEPDAKMLLDKTYKAFARNGAELSDKDKAVYGKYAEELSLLSLKFGKNVLEADNAFYLHLTEEAELEGLPQFVLEMGREAAKSKGLAGYVFTLHRPSYAAFMKYSAVRALREKLYMAYSTRAIGGELDNRETVRQMAGLRSRMASLLGYRTYADYAIENRMAKTSCAVNDFLDGLAETTLPYARKELQNLLDYARSNGFEMEVLMPWDLNYWEERYRNEVFGLKEEDLKPYLRLDNCIDAVFGLAGKLYGLKFTERSDIPVYHPDVKVYEVTDENGRFMALFYADFFPRPSKRGGAWMTEFRPQCFHNGAEERPFISIVTNFTKATASEPSLITHGELITLLHEFGHAIHGILSEGRYPSLTGTSVVRDFVELPSQIMENWGFEPEFLKSFAVHWQTGKIIPDDLVQKLSDSRKFLAAYFQMRQLYFGITDMKWHTLTSEPEGDIIEFEHSAITDTATLPLIPGCAFSPSFSHIFAGGYAAGYYSYKWAEVLEADAFSLFKENGIFDKVTAASFRMNILSKGGSEDAAELYRKFRGRNPDPLALLVKIL